MRNSSCVIGGTTKNVYGEIDLFALQRVPVQRSDGRAFFRLKLGSYLRGEDRLRALAERPDAADLHSEIERLAGGVV